MKEKIEVDDILIALELLNQIELGNSDQHSKFREFIFSLLVSQDIKKVNKFVKKLNEIIFDMEKRDRLKDDSE